MNWIHIHLALNHVPVLGTCFGLLLFVTACFRKSDDLLRLALSAFLLLAAVSIPIKFTGDLAVEAAEKHDWFSADLASAHEQTADQATTGMFLLGLGAAAARWQSRGSKPVPRWTVITVGLLALITAGLMARAANSGGQIRHEEIRAEVR